MTRRNFISYVLISLVAVLIWPILNILKPKESKLNRIQSFKNLFEYLTDSKISNEEFIIQILNTLDKKFSSKQINKILFEFNHSQNNMSTIEQLYKDQLYTSICQCILLIAYGDSALIQSWSEQNKMNAHLNFAFWNSLNIKPLGVPDRPDAWTIKPNYN